MRVPLFNTCPVFVRLYSGLFDLLFIHMSVLSLLSLKFLHNDTIDSVGYGNDDSK